MSDDIKTSKEPKAQPRPLLTPNLFTLMDSGVQYGLHRFKDNSTMILRQHSSGEWFTLCTPSADQVAVFEARGIKIAA